ncbi:GGDEF domain-containing protein [Methylomonas sp. MgM2]
MTDAYAGSEIRLLPFYFVPITLAGMSLSQACGYLFAVSCSILWGVANYHAGLRFSSDLIWEWNLLVQSIAFITVLELVRQLQAARIKEHEAARIDPLTGLLNSRALDEQARALIALCRRENLSIALAYIDLDNFKAVNDDEGHQRGDEILKIIADIMKSTFRASDLIARVGGDEFAVILPNTAADDAHEVLERCRIAISDQMLDLGNRVTTSIGCIAYSRSPLDPDMMIKTADQFMYNAKRSGKNRVSVKTLS